eukprot:TRINITY_DN1502_c0_g1_i3.p1 TRINITY_DN1502_c0_g1~~TRINITY_DN1502_c0_g1_i3.p1  ORF type:complete len:521 (-),score=161.79 TRINITY_DN1502_c0_g1_i3:83-1645(-)
MLEGILMPPDLGNVHAVNGILTSEPGKLKLKDLKAALAESSQHKGALEGRQFKEVKFLKEVSDEIDRERAVEIRPALPDCQVHTWGERPRSQSELEGILKAREDAYQEIMDAQHATARQRSATEVTEGRPVHTAKAVPMFYQPSWELETATGEADSTPATLLVQQQLVSLANGIMVEKRVGGRIAQLRAYLASFASKEQIAEAIAADNRQDQDETKSDKHKEVYAGVPVQPTLPQFQEQELGAPDPVNSKDLCCFDDLTPLALEVPKYFELMEYEPLKDVPVPSFTTLETSKLLHSGAEEEDLMRGWRAVVARPATALLPTGPPGALMSHQPTVIPPPPKQPVHKIPERCRDPVPANVWDLVKPPLRVRAYSQMLRYSETDCDTLLGPVAPDTSVSSLEEACGSNAVLSMWQLPTYQNVQDHSCTRLTRSWFDDSVPTLVSGPTPDMEMVQDVEVPATAEEASEEEEVQCEPVQVQHPYQDAVEALAEQVVQVRAGWSNRLEAGLIEVNQMIVHPKLKLH